MSLDHELLSAEEEKKLFELYDKTIASIYYKLTMKKPKWLDQYDDTKEVFSQLDLTNVLENSVDMEHKIHMTINHYSELSKDGSIMLNLILLKNIYMILVSANVRLIFALIRAYKINNIYMADIVQTGYLGLIKAIPKFSVKRGFKFSTFLTYGARQIISKALYEEMKDLRTPTYIINQMKQYLKENGFDFGFENVLLRRQISYFKQTGDDKKIIGEMISTKDDALPVEEMVRHECFKRSVRNILYILKPKEERIMRLKYGIDSEEMSTSEIIKHLGVTKERYRQILNNIYKKFEKHLQESKK